MKTITLDARRRTSLAKVGRKDDQQYLVEEHPDGRLVLTPATLVPAWEAELLSSPEVRAAFDRAAATPKHDTVSRGSFRDRAKKAT